LSKNDCINLISLTQYIFLFIITFSSFHTLNFSRRSSTISSLLLLYEKNIFIQPFYDNFWDNLILFISFVWQKQFMCVYLSIYNYFLIFPYSQLFLTLSFVTLSFSSLSHLHLSLSLSLSLYIYIYILSIFPNSLLSL